MILLNVHEGNISAIIDPILTKHGINNNNNTTTKNNKNNNNGETHKGGNRETHNFRDEPTDTHTEVHIEMVPT